MEVYTAIPLIPRSRGSGASPHLDRIRSHNARSVVKVLLVLIALITLLSVIVAHAMHKEQSHARSLELKLSGEDKLIDVKAIQETENPVLDLDGPRPTRYLRGSPVIHLILLDNESGSIEIHSHSTVISESSLEGEMQSMMHLEQEVEEMFGAMTMMITLENLFNGPLSGFDALDERSVGSAGPCFRDTRMIENKALEEEAEEKGGDTLNLEKNMVVSKSEVSKSEVSESEVSESEVSESEVSKSEEGDRDLVEEEDYIAKLVSNLASDEDLSVL